MQSPQVVSVGLELLDKAKIPFNLEVSGQQLTEFVDYFRRAVAADQQRIRELVGNRDCGRLVGYATYMASQAIRTGSVEDARRGLAAAVLEGVRQDFRNTVVALCLLQHSARKLGADPDILFREAAQLGTPKAEDFMLKYLARGEKRIEAMWFKEGIAEDGLFKYVVEPPPSPVRSRAK